MMCLLYIYFLYFLVRKNSHDVILNKYFINILQSTELKGSFEFL